jgi:hypothetical protein
MSQTTRLGKTATVVRQEGRVTVVRYHDTDVVKFTDAHITLNSGGWRTATTKLRMNQAASQYGLGFSVSQKDGVWFVTGHFGGSGAHHLPFEDGMILERMGRVIV